MKRHLKQLPLLLCLAGMLATDLHAQPVPQYLTAQRRPVHVSLGVLYERYDGLAFQDGQEEKDVSISQLSMPVSAFVPLGRRLSLSLLAAPATTTGDAAEASLTSVGGMNDVQLGLLYQQEVGRGSIVANLGVNLPSGKTALSEDEFATLFFLSQSAFEFRAPSTGLGLGLAPGVTWAVPLSDDLAFGLGAAYQYRGPYHPLAQADGSNAPAYDPGDELILTAGLDYRLTPTASVSGDVTYTRYARDKQGGDEIFQSGAKVTGTLMYRAYFGFNELRLVGRYRSKAPSSLLAAGQEFRKESEPTVPDQLLVQGLYRHRLSRAVTLGLVARTRLFGDTLLFDRIQLYDLGLTPEIALSERLRLVLQLQGTAGTFSGVETGLSMAVTL